MIILSENNAVEMGGVMSAPSAFKIANSAHAFGILSKTLYSDKIGAVTREIISNAYDAHVKAGTPDKVIEVHLPTTLEPVFSVKDEGIGLNHESMTELYTTYFSSTKQNNDEIGGFGLGCKSPFAYTKNFTVVSVFEGVMRSYSLMVNEDGVPVIVLLDEEETLDHNGVTVSVPVNNSYDRDEFITKTANVLEFFPHFKSNLTNFKASTTKYANKGPFWGIRDTKNDNHVFHTRPRVIVGKVAYTFETGKLTKLSDEDKGVLALPIDLFFNIGDLDVTPSRETLSLNPRTQANLLARLRNIQDSIIESLRVEIEGAESMWFAKLALKTRLEEGSPYRSLVKKVIKNYFPQYQGMTLDGLNTYLELTNYEALGMVVRRYKTYQRKMEKTVNLASEVYNRKIGIETADNVFFYMNDTFSFVPKTTKRLLEILTAEHPGKDITLYLLNPAKGCDTLTMNDEFSLMVDELGVPPMNFVSDLPALPKVPRSPRVASDTSKYAWTWAGRNSTSRDNNWTHAEASDLEGDGPFFYVPLERLECTMPGIDNDVIFKAFGSARKLNVTVEVNDEEVIIDRNTTLFGLNTQGLKRIAKNTNWVNALEVLKTVEYDVPQEYLSYLASRSLCVSFNNLPELFEHYTRGYCDTLRPFIKGTEFHRQAVMVMRIKQLVDRATRKTDTASLIETFINFTGQKVEATAIVPDAITNLQSRIDIDMIRQRYPMLAYTTRSRWGMDTDYCRAVGDYLKSCEQ